jgi:DNA (cytosine-5)-methyltransferase 1
MSALTIGSLCSGYGGLDLAVESFFGAETAWFSEFEAAPSKVLEAHWPGVPNLGDMTKIDWASVEPVDIVTGGTPCQDLSAAGRRRGMTEGTRSNLWVQMRECIAAVKPQIVVWENVRGAYSARADSDVESEPGLLGIGPDRPALRALGRVLGDLSDLGFDAEWVGVRASDAGAPHGRFRVFVVAYSSSNARRVRNGDDVHAWRGTLGRVKAAGRSAAPVPTDIGHERTRDARNWGLGSADGGHAAADTDRDGLEVVGRIDTIRRDAHGSRGAHSSWGAYEPAIRRWEHVLGRVAPAPTNPDGKGGAHRLAPEFVEWMMGLLAGHVTDVGISRAEQLKALGNGVIPQQAELALSIAWPRLADVREAVAA